MKNIYNEEVQKVFKKSSKELINTYFNTPNSDGLHNIIKLELDRRYSNKLFVAAMIGSTLAGLITLIVSKLLT